jgi:hypothetical protein
VPIKIHACYENNSRAPIPILKSETEHTGEREGFLGNQHRQGLGRDLEFWNSVLLRPSPFILENFGRP